MGGNKNKPKMRIGPTLSQSAKCQINFWVAHFSGLYFATAGGRKWNSNEEWHRRRWARVAQQSTGHWLTELDIGWPTLDQHGKRKKSASSWAPPWHTQFWISSVVQCSKCSLLCTIICFPVRHFFEHNLSIRHRKDKSTKSELIVDEKGKKRKRPAASGNFNSA